jgi:hypothetical protein
MMHARTFTAAFLALSITGCSGAQTVRCTTWNLEWFPNGSANETSTAQQEQRIKEAADVLRPINPDILLLQEVRDYDACARLGEAIAPGKSLKRPLPRACAYLCLDSLNLHALRPLSSGSTFAFGERPKMRRFS